MHGFVQPDFGSMLVILVHVMTARSLSICWLFFRSFTDFQNSNPRFYRELPFFSYPFARKREGARMPSRARKVGKRRVRQCRNRRLHQMNILRARRGLLKLYMTCFMPWFTASSWNLSRRQEPSDALSSWQWAWRQERPRQRRER